MLCAGCVDGFKLVYACHTYRYTAKPPGVDERGERRGGGCGSLALVGVWVLPCL